MACRANKTAAVVLIASLKPCEVFNAKGEEEIRLSGKIINYLHRLHFQLVDYL